MINTKELTYALLIGGIAIATAYSQNKDTEYVAPPDAGPKGKAPRMKVQLLNPGEPPNQPPPIFYAPDAPPSPPLAPAHTHHATTPHLPATAPPTAPTLRWPAPQRKMHTH